MDIYKRYFRIIEGPVIDFIKESDAINEKADEQYQAILDEVGATHRYYHRGRKMTAMIFDGEPDRALFKKSGDGWWPKKTTKAGKDLVARLEAIETQDPNDILKLLGLSSSPRIFSGGKCYWPTTVTLREDKTTVYIIVPWFDEDPEKIEQYRQDRDAGKRGDCNLDAIMWEPLAEMEEVKGWEVDKHIDTYNESIKAA